MDKHVEENTVEQKVSLEDLNEDIHLLVKLLRDILKHKEKLREVALGKVDSPQILTEKYRNLEHNPSLQNLFTRNGKLFLRLFFNDQSELIEVTESTDEGVHQLAVTVDPAFAHKKFLFYFADQPHAHLISVQDGKNLYYSLVPKALKDELQQILLQIPMIQKYAEEQHVFESGQDKLQPSQEGVAAAD